MVKRNVVGAHYGLRDWIAQRATAVYMVLYSVAFVLVSLFTPSEQLSLRAVLSGSCMRFLTLLFFLTLCYHAWIGVRDIFMDYVKPLGLRLTLHVAAILLLIGYAAWAAKILLLLGA